ncbi:hypothetical protein V496_03947 [Pseudogymnoascus sp. VKM F-4515 (FW-2607)]|nr:hypothetical protein V496_03947 [Pseudogymnoascus sp. VKM F-4515 (FW-2607)]
MLQRHPFEVYKLYLPTVLFSNSSLPSREKGTASFTASTALTNTAADKPFTERNLEIPTELAKRAYTTECACSKGIKAGPYYGLCRCTCKE